MNSTRTSTQIPPITDFEKSQTLRERAKKVIPGGAHTYSKGDDQFPALSPGFVVRGDGCTIWDCDGNQFLDWGMGLRSVILGYAYKPVLDAVTEMLGSGSNFTRPHPIETEFAELLVDLIPAAEMVKFAKNGSDVTTAAVKLARAYTERDLVARCKEHAFFSVDDWFIGDTLCKSGVPQAIQDLTKRFSFNDVASLEQLFADHPKQIAAVILEPAATEEPKEGFLQKVKAICEREGAVFILDEIITGFRWHPKGAQFYYGVTPDLATFGKAIANGFSVSALVGKREILELGGLEHSRERVFLLSTTHGGETHSLAAASATVKEVVARDVSKHLWEVGKLLQDGFNQLSGELGIGNFVQASGIACSPLFVFKDKDNEVSAPLRTLFLQEMIRNGVLIPYIAPSLAHTSREVDITLEAARQALLKVRQAIELGSTNGLLVGEPTRPVFRRFNR